MTYQYHNESIIKSLAEDTVFVFGSNMAGTHQGGRHPAERPQRGLLRRLGTPQIGRAHV